MALVTGANTGVGYQIAKSLAEEGYTVYVRSRNKEKGEIAVGEIGKQSKAIQLDITDFQYVEGAVKQIQSETGYLTLLVNNAAISNAGKPGCTMEEVLGAQRARIWIIVAASCFLSLHHKLIS